MREKDHPSTLSFTLYLSGVVLYGKQRTELGFSGLGEEDVRGLDVAVHDVLWRRVAVLEAQQRVPYDQRYQRLRQALLQVCGYTHKSKSHYAIASYAMVESDI